MNRLFGFFYDNRAFFTFLILELMCAWLIVQNNQYQSASYFNSSNKLAANILGFSNGVREYFSLRVINRELADENATLRTKLEQRNQSLYSLEVREIKDPAIVNRYEYVSAKVVNNTTSLFKNYITINRGEDAGIDEDEVHTPIIASGIQNSEFRRRNTDEACDNVVTWVTT